MARSDARRSAEVAALAARVAGPEQAVARLERRGAEADARLAQAAGAAQGAAQAAERQTSQLRLVGDALTDMDASVQARPLTPLLAFPNLSNSTQ